MNSHVFASPNISYDTKCGIPLDLDAPAEPAPMYAPGQYCLHADVRVTEVLNPEEFTTTPMSLSAR